VRWKNLYLAIFFNIQSVVFADSGVKTYTLEDYLVYALGLAFIIVGAAILLDILR
jgi:hypothetical protein